MPQPESVFLYFEGVQGLKLSQQESAKCCLAFILRMCSGINREGRNGNSFSDIKCQHHKQKQHEQSVLMVLLSSSAIRKLACANSAHKSGIQIAIVISSPKFQEELSSTDRDWSTSFWAPAQSRSHPGSAQKQGLQWNDISQCQLEICPCAV